MKIGILGATGTAGLEFVRALTGHPWFEITELYASAKSVGKTVEEACSVDIRRELHTLPDTVLGMTVKGLDNISSGIDLLCSALPSDVAKDVEGECAVHTPVVSTTSAYRYDEDVPIMITEVNADHYKALELQKKRGWKGWIAPGPNCTTVGLVMSLYPLLHTVGINKVIMSSYQSVSGGGSDLIQKWKSQKKAELPTPLEGEVPLETVNVMVEGNVIGYIEKEEEKVQKETRKILGSYHDSLFIPNILRVDCSCVRVPTLYGHFETVFVETTENCSAETVKLLWEQYNVLWNEKYGNLPSSPKKTIHVMERTPQPYFDAFAGGGMSIVTGRVEKTVFSNGIKYQVLSNNTKKGAAKGMIQVAEYLYSIGFLREK